MRSNTGVTIEYHFCLMARNSYQRWYIKNVTIFTGKHLRWSLFLLKPASLLERDSNLCFPVNIAKFLRTLILKKVSEQLLLNINIVSHTVSYRKWENEKKGKSKSLVMSLPKVIPPNHSKQTVYPPLILDIFSTILMLLKLSQNTDRFVLT